jgi:nitrite reductase/ring-hydroxylating ferredoxin subunit
MSSVHTLSLADLRATGRLRIVDGSRSVLVLEVDGEVFAVDESCPHRGNSLGQGVVRDGVITCPAHLFQYDVRSGARHDTRGDGLATYPVAVDGDRVEVTLPDDVPALSMREILLAHARDSR